MGLEPGDHKSSYDRAVRFNFSDQEKSDLMLVIGYIKAAAARFKGMLPTIVPLIQERLFTTFQTVLQKDLRQAGLALANDKRSAALGRRVLQHVDLCGDWLVGHAPESGAGDVDIPAKAAQPHPLTVEITRALVAELIGPQHRKTAGKQTPVKSGRLAAWLQHSLAMHHIDGAALDATASACSDIGHLWLREMYLSIEKAIQFPTSSSLPYAIAAHASRDDPSVSSLITLTRVPLHIYDDAARLILNKLRQRHLYRELEAEANLCLGQLIYIISDMILRKLMTVSATSHLDPVHASRCTLQRMASKKGATGFEPVALDFSHMFRQPAVSVMGRTINLALEIGRQLTGFIVERLTIVIGSFSEAPLSQLVEAGDQISILTGAASMAARMGLAVPPPAALISQVDRAGGPSTLAGMVIGGVDQVAKATWVGARRVFEPTTRRITPPAQGAGAGAAPVRCPTDKAKCPTFLSSAPPSNPLQLPTSVAQAHAQWWTEQRRVVSAAHLAVAGRLLDPTDMHRLVVAVGAVAAEHVSDSDQLVLATAKAAPTNPAVLKPLIVAANCLRVADIIDEGRAGAGAEPIATPHVAQVINMEIAAILPDRADRTRLWKNIEDAMAQTVGDTTVGKVLGDAAVGIAAVLDGADWEG